MKNNDPAANGRVPPGGPAPPAGDGFDAEGGLPTLEPAPARPAADAAPSSRPQVALQRLLETGQATIGVVGLGYVGLPLAVEFARKGFRTVGIDVSTERVLRLNAGQSYIGDVPDEALRAVVEAGTLVAEDGFASGADVDVFFICVPTPVTVYKDPDTSYIEAAARAVAEHLRAGQLVVLKSTTYPNTTEGLVQPILAAAAAERGLQLGRDYFLAFSPERVDPGNAVYTTANTPVVVGGVTRACGELAALAMRQVVEHVHFVSSPKVAEMEKLLENIYRSVNIALVNELARLCDRMGNVSIWEVVEAAATKPFGFMPFFPGPGLGGHCIPIDPYYLSWVARRYDFETSFITLSAQVNEGMPFYVTETVVRAIAQEGVRLRDARVLVLGAAFKRDVDDVRHSPSLRLMGLLHERGVGEVAYSDPYVPRLRVDTDGAEALELESVPLTEEALARYDVVVVATDHSAFAYDFIAEHARAIVDTRNALKHVRHDRDKIILLGGGAPPSERRHSNGHDVQAAPAAALP
ncbi:MAG TPA: nucleotide sugar dehydrogenase [Rubricoccaceae bacterium]|nr:nucleotide sugar dehydrogenase [Rubricoccaceae bacterium]